MPTLKQPSQRKSLADLRLELIWGAWAELGVSGWSRTHDGWAMDPEPLILHTAALDDEDPRLRDEVTDWCVRYWRYVSRVRLRNLLREEQPDVRASFGEFAATVNLYAGVTWPGATLARPYKTTGRSMLPSLAYPSLIWLRLRAIFGLGARTEILRHFLSRNGGAYSVVNLAISTGYTKRNVAEECQLLERAGLLVVSQVSNRFYYSLARRQALTALVGDAPEVFPQWTPLLRTVDALVALERTAGVDSSRVTAIEARRTLDLVESNLAALGVKGPVMPLRGESLWPTIEAWSKDLLVHWAKGLWPRYAEGGVVSQPARQKAAQPSS